MQKSLIKTLGGLGLTTVALSALLLGCEQQNAAKPGNKDVTTEQAKSVPSDAVADDKACEKYGDEFCKATGERSPSCQSIKVVTGLMSPKACQAGLTDIEYTKTQVANLSKKCTELQDKLCNDLGPDTQTCGMVKQMTPKIPPEQCNQMLGEYDKVLAELKAQEEMNKPLSPEKQQKLLANNPPSFGPENAPVTIVEFSDFQCPYCTMAGKAVNEIKAKYPDKVRVIFRHFPLPFHQDAHLTSQAAMAAGEQGKFWEFHNLVFDNQKALSRADLEKYAQQLKLNMPKFKEALDSGKYKKVVDDDLALGQEVTVQGTPTMFLNGERVSNPTDFGVISAMIDKKLAEPAKAE